jgi:hypothetical protein
MSIKYGIKKLMKKIKRDLIGKKEDKKQLKK